MIQWLQQLTRRTHEQSQKTLAVLTESRRCDERLALTGANGEPIVIICTMQTVMRLSSWSIDSGVVGYFDTDSSAREWLKWATADVLPWLWIGSPELHRHPIWRSLVLAYATVTPNTPIAITALTIVGTKTQWAIVIDWAVPNEDIIRNDHGNRIVVWVASAREIICLVYHLRRYG